MVEAVGMVAIIVVSIMLFTGIVKGTLGFGLTVVSVPLLIFVLPTKLVLAIITIPAIIANYYLVYDTGLPRKFISNHWLFMSLLVVFTIVGVIGLAVLSTNVLFIIISLYLFVFIIANNISDDLYKYADVPGFSVISATAGGALGGAIGMAGPPLIPYTYLRTMTESKALFISAITLQFSIINTIRLPSLYVSGLFGTQEVLWGIAITVPLFAGLWVGGRVREVIPVNLFERAVDLMLLLVAFKILWDGVGPLL